MMPGGEHRPMTDGPPRTRLLIVDDEEGIRSVLQRLLTRMPQPPPLEVETAESAEEALKILESRSFAMILTDFNMAGEDGIFLLATARERWPDTMRALMTGYTDDQIAVDAKEKANVAALIRKPWNNAELLGLLKDLLHGKPAAAP